MLSIGDMLHQRKAADVLPGSRGMYHSNALHVAGGWGNRVWKSPFLPNMIFNNKGGGESEN